MSTVAEDKRLLFYVTEKLGPKRSRTPEGFLLCEDVPIARTGEMVYGPNETPIGPGLDGLVRISRTPEEVFRPKTLASFNGKPVTLDHPPIPDDDGWPLTSENWAYYAKGTVMNPRRGVGEQKDLLIADLLIQDKSTADLVEKGEITEVSCGYDSEYVEDGPGRGHQTEIVGNHVALVQEGRCGSACSIGDRAFVADCKTIVTGSQPEKRRKKMKIGDMVSGWVASVREALKTKDETKINATLDQISKDAGEMMDEGGGLVQHIHAGGGMDSRSKFSDEALEAKFAEYDKMHTANDAVHKTYDEALAGHDDRLKKLEGGAQDDAANSEAEALLAEAPEGATGDEEYENKVKGATDSAFLEFAYQTTIGTAEILAPGIHVHTFDRAAKPKVSFDAICGVRRKALQIANRDSGLASALASMNKGRVLTDDDIRKLPCAKVRDSFYALGEVKKQLNARPVTVAATVAVPTTLAALNKRHHEKYQ